MAEEKKPAKAKDETPKAEKEEKKPAAKADQPEAAKSARRAGYAGAADSGPAGEKCSNHQRLGARESLPCIGGRVDRHTDSAVLMRMPKTRIVTSEDSITRYVSTLRPLTQSSGVTAKSFQFY